MFYRIKKIFFFIIFITLNFFSNLIPKKKNNWVFGAWFGKRFSDNPKVFFEYVCNNHPEINAIWISNDKEVVFKIRKLGYQAHVAHSLKGLLAQICAEKVFVCTSAHDDLFAPAIGRKTKIINFWHGLPIKKIMFDAFDKVNNNKNFWGRLEDLLTPYNQHRNNLILATSHENKVLLAKAFQVREEQVVITGSPRNDVFQSCNKANRKKSTFFKCLYVPTFRGGIGSEFDLFHKYGFDVEKIDKVLNDNDISLVLRLHPFNRPTAKLLAMIAEAERISLDTTQDLYESITDYDLLITDYSSGYLDFILSGRPILFAPFDLESYIENDRNLYYDYKSVTFPPYSCNWDELISNVVKVKKEELPHEYFLNYSVLLKRFHDELPEEFRYSKNVFNAVINF